MRVDKTGHKIMSVEDFFDSIRFLHKLQATGLLAHTYKLIEDGKLKLGQGAIFGEELPSSDEPSRDGSKAEIVCYLQRVSTLSGEVRSQFEKSIVSELQTWDCVWYDILQIESIHEYLKADHELTWGSLHEICERDRPLEGPRQMEHLRYFSMFHTEGRGRVICGGIAQR